MKKKKKETAVVHEIISSFQNERVFSLPLPQQRCTVGFGDPVVFAGVSRRA